MYRKVFADIITDKAVKTGSNLMVSCPWHSDTNPSFGISTDPNKRVYHCMSCGRKGSFVNYWMQRHNVSYTQAVEYLELDNVRVSAPIYRQVTPEPKPLLDYTDEVVSYINNFHDNYEKYGQLLYNRRGITFSAAVGCAVGVKDNNWIFPVFKYPEGDCVGYELRKLDFSLYKFKNGNTTKCYKSKGTPSCISIVFSPLVSNGIAIVCEGFVDSIFMYQYLQERDGQVKHTILTSSCGVAHLPELVKEAGLLKEFDEVIYMLDNDAAGDAAAELIEPLSDRFTFYDGIPEGEDVEMAYKAGLL